MKLFNFLFAVTLSISSIHLSANIYNVVDFGAVNDGKTVNTLAIQRAIDKCTAEGGGTVLLSGGGKFMTGTIYLKDNVTLKIDNGTTLLGSNNLADYTTDTYKNMYKDESHMDRCLIFAQDAVSIALIGKGTIDGNGNRADSIFIDERPMMIRFLNCRNIRINDLSLINPAAWTSAFLYCDDIVVNGITIISRVNWNGDGLNFDSCTNVRVSNSNFDTSDDSICLQASRPDKPCRDVVISNCTFSSKWAGMRIGLLSRGDFSSVTVTNCTFRNIEDSGLKIQMIEGGEMKNMVFSNLVMENVPRPVFMTFAQQRAAVDAPMELAPMKAMRRFNFQNIIIDNSSLDKNSVFFLTGLPDHCIEDIIISNIQFIVSGGGTKEDAAKEVKEFTPDVLGNWWPEFYLIGTLPAFGIYARHINGLTINNFSIKSINPDARKAFRFENVDNVYLNMIRVNNEKVTFD